MNQDLVKSSRKIAMIAFVATFVSIFCIAFGINTLNAFFLQKSYVSTASVRVSTNNSSGVQTHTIQNEIEAIQSETVLSRAVKLADLNRTFGKLYNGGVNLDVQETINILKNRMTVHLVENTGLIDIKVYGFDRNEAAWTANTIAGVYSDYRNNPQIYGTASSNVKVELVDRAVSAIKPVGPNVPLEILRGAFSGILIALASGAIVAWISYVIALNARMRAAMQSDGRFGDSKLRI